MAVAAGEIALSKKAVDVKVLDLREITSVTDFFLVCSGNIDVHVKAISDAIIEGLKKQNIKAWHVEGYSALKWVLLDYVDVVVHIFDREVRDFYRLEHLWGDAPMEMLSDQKVKSAG
ncbi:ribosome silencing factor [bacterium]|nr:ribosome silencing factor [bacterium]